MISKELKSQINILRETNPEYIQTLKDSITESYKAKLQSIKPSSTEEEEQLNIELKDIVLNMLFGPFYNYFVSEYVVSDTIWEEQDQLIEDLYYYFKSWHHIFNNNLKSYAIIQIGMTICSVDKIYLANFLNEDQGYESGISMYGHYIACKCLDISSEEEYMNQ